MLASQYSPFDELSAEFIRAFRHELFFGKYFLDRYDVVYNKQDATIDKCLPKNQIQKGCRDVVSLYGLRGTNPRLYYMSPWEFTQWWEPMCTRRPSRFYKHTMWLPNADYERAQPGFGLRNEANEVRAQRHLCVSAEASRWFTVRTIS